MVIIVLYSGKLHRSTSGFDWSCHRDSLKNVMILKLAEEKKTVTTFATSSISSVFTNRSMFINATGVIASDNVNLDLAVVIRTKIVSGFDGKTLGEKSLERKDQANKFVTIRLSVKVDETVVHMSSEQLSQRLLASVVRDEAPLVCKDLYSLPPLEKLFPLSVEPTSIILEFFPMDEQLNLQKAWNRSVEQQVVSVEIKIDCNISIP